MLICREKMEAWKPGSESIRRIKVMGRISGDSHNRLDQANKNYIKDCS